MAGETVVGDESYRWRLRVAENATAKPSAELTLEDQDLIEEARKAQLMIDDPIRFEQEAIDEHLQD